MECIDPERWPRLRAILEAALDIPPVERAAFLEEACGDDHWLRAKVDALLAAEARAGSFLQSPVGVYAGALLGALEQESGAWAPQRMGGRRIGPYRILHEIGHGGMGTVYLAERDDIEKRVALKLVRAGLASSEATRRFLFERRVLARLEHVHIARLLDAGMTEEGTPYFAMEYVEGLPIDAYCDQKQLSIDARLQLFQTVCQAVQYAHQNLVVHRDLKPSNILVTEDPVTGKPVVKLLDFGIAKLLEEDASTEPLTQTGVRVMTPEYAAPEQVCGAAVTTATDVYALGVVLYELLVGRRPYEVEGTAPHEMERVVLHVEPKKPSVLVGERRTRHAGLQDTATAAVTEARATTTEKLRRRLRGDLDVMVLKALKKEPARRYESAEQFLQDIKRHLAGQPVVARKDTLSYRARTFVRRHRIGVTGTMVAFVVIAVLMGYHTRRLAQERDRAQQEAAKSAQVTAFMMGLFEANDPREALGEEITARELVERGVAQAEELSDQPAVQAQMLDVMGGVYQRLGQYEKARPLLERALAMRRTLLGAEHPDVAESLNNLAVLLCHKGDYAAAEPLYREALAMQRRLLGPAHPDVAVTLNNLAVLLRHKGDYAAAESLYREALAMRQRLLGPEHPDVATTMNNLAALLQRKGDYAAAEPLYREALAMQRRLLGPAHPDVAMTLHNLALLLKEKGDYAAAEPRYREVLAMQRRLLGPEHPDVATTMNNLAVLLREKGDYAAAESLCRETLAMRRRLLGPEHPDVARSLNNLALVLQRRGDYAAAEPLYRQALAMKQTLLGAEHPSLATSLHNLGDLLKEKGDYTAAEPLLEQALAMRRKQLGENHPHVAQSLERLIALYEAWHRPDKAGEYRALLAHTTDRASQGDARGRNPGA